MPTRSIVTRITVARLFSLGNYEHIRYEVTAEVDPTEKPSAILNRLCKTIEELRPNKSVATPAALKSDWKEIQYLASVPEEEWSAKHGWRGASKAEVIKSRLETYKAALDAYHDAKRHEEEAKRQLDDLGGASTFTDAKLDWDDNQEF